MSEGAIRLSEGVYSWTGAETHPSRESGGTECSEDLFEDVAYLPGDGGKLETLTDDFGISEDNVWLINKAIGGFLQKVQEESFVPWSTVGVIPQDGVSYMQYQATLKDMAPRVTTLPPHVLAGVVRRELAGVIREIIDLSGNENLQAMVESVPKAESEVHVVNSSMQFSRNSVKFRDEDLFNAESAALIELMGDEVAKLIRRQVKILTNNIYAESERSFRSFRTDVTRFARARLDDEDIAVTEGSDYSTLNPAKLAVVGMRSVDFAVPNLKIGLEGPKVFECQTNSRTVDDVVGFFRGIGFDPSVEVLDEPPASGYGLLMKVKVKGFDPWKLEGENLRTWQIEIGNMIG